MEETNVDETISFTDTMDNTMTTPSQERLVIQRHLYTQVALDEAYKDPAQPSTLRDVVKNACSRVTPKCVGRELLGYIPLVSVLRGYQWRQWLLSDLLSGLSTGFIHLPQGLGFGLLASLQPVNGLYTSFFPVLVYLLLGTSPHVSFGTNALIALLTAALVEREGDRYKAEMVDPDGKSLITPEEFMQYKVTVAAAACFISGLILLGMGLARLGFITSFMSRSLIGGFTFGAAVHITTSQIIKLLGVKNLPRRTGAGKLVLIYIDIFRNITTVSPADIIVGLICIAVLLGVKLGINERYKHKLKIPIPIELIVVIVSTIVSHFALLHDRFGLAVVGDVPTGVPAPALPRLDCLGRIASESFVIAVLVFALTISLAKLTAKLHDVTINDNQELVAYGMVLVVGAFFRNFPSCTAPPRTMVLSSLKSRSTLNGLAPAAFMLLVLLVAGQLFQALPIAMLAAMIIVAMKDLLLQIRTIKSLWNVNKADFFIWVVTASVGVLADLDIGLLVGMIFSMITVLAVGQLAKGTLLGRAEKEDMIMSLDRQGVRPVPGVRIFRFESALYFASLERFKSQLFSQVMNPSTRSFTLLRPATHASPTTSPIDTPTRTSPDNPEKIQPLDAKGLHKVSADTDGPQDPDSDDVIQHVILDCSALTYIDVSGVDMLQTMVGKFSGCGVKILLASVPASAWATLQRSGFLDQLGRDKVFYTVLDALQALRPSQLINVKL